MTTTTTTTHSTVTHPSLGRGAIATVTGERLVGRRAGCYSYVLDVQWWANAEDRMMRARVTVYRDSYDFQSSGKIEVLDASVPKWNVLASREGELVGPVLPSAYIHGGDSEQRKLDACFELASELVREVRDLLA